MHLPLSLVYHDLILMNYGFGGTELTKAHGDEVGRVLINHEKPYNTHVQESTTNVIAPQKPKAAQNSEEREVMI
jgi:hypothetical protein